jgi:hypothetical protein
MTHFTLFSVGAAVSLVRAARPRRYCRPTDHLPTVVGRRRVRDALSKQYWIRCRVCDLEHGPYDDWQAAWLDAFRAQIATRRRAVSRTRSLRPAT